MTSKRFIELMKQKNALLEGHFLLSSGLHSSKYLQCAIILQYPQIAERIGKALANRYKWHIKKKADVVLSPAIGGIIVGQEVAKVLRARAMFCEREEGKMKLRRGFSLSPEERVVVAEDVITTGGSIKELMQLVQDAGASVIAVAALVDRSAGKINFNIPKVTIATMEIEAFKPEECPLCKENIPVVKPGSRKFGTNIETGLTG